MLLHKEKKMEGKEVMEKSEVLKVLKHLKEIEGVVVSIEHKVTEKSDNFFSNATPITLLDNNAKEPTAPSVFNNLHTILDSINANMTSINTFVEKI